MQVITIALLLLLAAALCAHAAEPSKPLTVGDCHPRNGMKLPECQRLVSFCSTYGISMSWFTSPCKGLGPAHKGCQCADRCSGSALFFKIDAEQRTNM